MCDRVYTLMIIIYSCSTKMIDEFHNHHLDIIHKRKAPDREPSINFLLGALLDDLEESNKECTTVILYVILHHSQILHHHATYYQCHLMGKEQCLSCCLQPLLLQIWRD